jgi:hypothetical protein
VQFEFGSFVRPRTLFEYGPESGRPDEIWQASVPRYRSHDHESRRVFATSPDGTRVPISLVCKKPLVLGRAFCGWFCPGAAMQEILSLIKSPAKAGPADRIKYGICGGWSLLVLGMALRARGFHRDDRVHRRDP